MSTPPLDPRDLHDTGSAFETAVAAEEALSAREARLLRQNLALYELTDARLADWEEVYAALERIASTLARTLDLRQAGLWLAETAAQDLRCVAQYSGEAAGATGSAAEVAALEIPIRHSGRPLGVLRLHRDAAGRTWEPDEVNFAGSIAHLASLVWQADENRRIRRELEERERHFDHLLSSAGCLFWEACVTERDGDLNWQIWMIDEVSAQRFLPLETAEGQSYCDAWYWSKSPEDHLRMDVVSERALRQGDAGYQQEFSCRQADGRVRWFWEDVRIETVAERQWALVGVCTDITARKRAEQRDVAFWRLGVQLNQAGTPEEAGRILLRVADDLLKWDACWLALQDPEDDSLRFTVVMDEIDGRRAEVPPPGPLLGISPLAHRALDEGPFRLLREAGEVYPTGLRFGDLSRTTRSILVVPIRHRERNLGVLSVQSYTPEAYSPEDLRTLEALADYCAGALERTRIESARTRLEEELRQAQKMEAIGRLAGGVAHDFNNMLMVINGYAALLSATLPAGSPPGEAVREIALAGERAAALTRQLLAFSRKQVLAPQVLDLCGVLESLGPMIHRLIGEDIELQIECPTGIGPVEADPRQLELALVNLVVNARDAMPRGGRLLLAASNLEHSPFETEDSATPRSYVELSVADTGTGMTPEIRERVFEPFFTTKEAGRGTGLGLSTVFGIVRQSGGRIEVESTAGQGSTFRIYLPRIRP